jgi:hypothetical protein
MILRVDTRASLSQAVVLTWCPTSPPGADGCPVVADSRVCAVPLDLPEAAGFGAAWVGASGEKRVQLTVLGTVMMSLAWRWIVGFRTACRGPKALGYRRHAAQRTA